MSIADLGHQVAGSESDPERCGGRNRVWQCAGEPYARVTLACVHEHDGTSHVCRECVDTLRVLIAAGDFVCEPCMTGREPHRCPVLIMALTEDEPGPCMLDSLTGPAFPPRRKPDYQVTPGGVRIAMQDGWMYRAT